MVVAITIMHAGCPAINSPRLRATILTVFEWFIENIFQTRVLWSYCFVDRVLPI
jgi:hypothetical protein